MGEMLSFVVRIPRQALSDLALNMHGDDLSGVQSANLSEYLRDAIVAGLEEYLGDDEVPEKIEVRPANG